MDLTGDQIKAFLDAAPDAIVIADEAGRIAFVNIETEAMFQYPRTALIGEPVEMLLPERLRARHRDHFVRYCLSPRRRPMGHGLELYGLRRDGVELPVEISLSPVSTAHGMFISSAIRDMSDRKSIERKLIEAREFAEQANRAKSQFLAAASHDLRQPLQTLTLLSSALSRIVPSGSRAATAVANQSEALRLMSELLNSLLDISKLEAGAIKPDIRDCSVRRIFRRLRAEFEALAEAKGLELLIDDSDSVVRSDPTLLSQIIQNLLGNAIRYTQQGWVRLRCLADSASVRIEVLDTGVGIPQEELGRIFEDFYQRRDETSRMATEGAGLGLSIARRIAGLLGCELEARSTVGKGSHFCLTVPRSAAPDAGEDYTDGCASAELFDDRLVVVIDDDAAVGDATIMLLSSLGVRSFAVPTAARALERLGEFDAPPDLLICDYHLGEAGNGLDAIREVRAATALELPVILVSGDTSPSMERIAAEIPDCHLLSKPVAADVLLDLIANLMRSRASKRSVG